MRGVGGGGTDIATSAKTVKKLWVISDKNLNRQQYAKVKQMDAY